MYVNHVSKERTSREPFLTVERNEDTPCNDIQGIEDIRKLMVFLTNFLQFLITSVLAKAKKLALSLLACVVKVLEFHWYVLIVVHV